MKTIYVATKIQKAFRIIWALIKEAFLPEWRKMPLADASDTKPEPVVVSSTAMQEPISGQVTPANSTPETSGTPAPISDPEKNEQMMATAAEIARLNAQIDELKKELNVNSVISDALEKLKVALTNEKKAHEGNRGRPKKNSVSRHLNLRPQWLILFNAGKELRLISMNLTDFVNEALELMIKTVYPELYGMLDQDDDEL